MERKTLFIFRRDLRLEDNTALNEALRTSEFVLPCFIFTPQQIEKNPYRSEPSIQFMLESLEDLEEEFEKKGGKLYLFYGKPEEIVALCIEELGIDQIALNRDYTPYSIERDRKIESICKKQNALFRSFDDSLLHPPEETLKANGKPYTVFTPYFRNAQKLQIEKPHSSSCRRFYTKPIPFAKKATLLKEILPQRNPSPLLAGGRKAGLKTLHKAVHLAKNYEKERDFPFLNSTTHLSAYLKFNTLSIREVYSALLEEFSQNHPLIRSLYWRDFFTQIALFFPSVFEGAFHPKYNRLKWSYDKKIFETWCKGETGFPIVDAGMRQLNETGFMHNRVRMITASFLTKDLHIDWRMGEKYFAQKLIDYDPALNNGNWQWVASTGCDAQPYFRIFNPWNQQKKFDPECAYIKKWIPELKNETKERIHAGKASSPMLDHTEEAKKSLKLYQAVS